MRNTTKNLDTTFLKDTLENIQEDASSCGCGHDHEHDHDHAAHAHEDAPSCGCGHDHDHAAHAHEDAPSCGCGHDHEHEHGDDCDCGHDHDNAVAAPFSNVIGIVGLVAIIASFVLPMPAITGWLMIVGTLMVGYPLFLVGFKGIMKFKFDELALLTIAVCAAIAIGEAPEAAMVTLLFRLGNWLEAKAISKSKRNIASLTQIRPDNATLVDASGETTVVPAKSVQKGSKILVKPGERVPIDCVVESGSTYIDTSALTGEPLPVQAAKGTSILSGSMNTDGVITCLTTNSFENSAASRIIKMVSEAASQKGETERLISRFSKVYTPIVLICALLLAILPPIFGFGEFTEWISRALVFLVASCPCALVISVPLTFFAGVGRATKLGVLIKGTKYIETLAKTDCVVFDKTGTLTYGVPVVDKVIPADGVSETYLLKVAATAEQFSNHPAAKAILERAEDYTRLSSPSYTETPGMGITLDLGNKKIICGSFALMAKNDISTANMPIANIYVAEDNKLLGCITLTDKAREDAKPTIEKLYAMGIKTVAMLSGDNKNAATAIANQLGIQTVYSQLLPENKVEKMAEIKKNHTSSLFVGDGINDAPVLAMSDVGIAMGLGTDTAIEAADIVLMNESLKSLPTAIALAKSIVRKAKFNIAFALTIKIGVLILGALGHASMWMAVFADVGVSIIAVLNAVSHIPTSKE